MHESASRPVDALGLSGIAIVEGVLDVKSFGRKGRIIHEAIRREAGEGMRRKKTKLER